MLLLVFHHETSFVTHTASSSGRVQKDGWRSQLNYYQAQFGHLANSYLNESNFLGNIKPH
jgi:hypothetical protein